MRLLFFISLYFLSHLSIAQDSIEFKNWFLKQDGKDISQLFAESISVELPDSKETYSKTQAKIIVNNFLKDINPIEYSSKHSGGGDKRSNYEIGILLTEKSKYRTYLLYNKSDELIEIIELRIELEN